MKKLGTWLIIALVVVVLAGCGNSAGSSATTTQTQETNTASKVETSNGNGIEVDKNLLTVDMTFSPTMAQALEISEESLINKGYFEKVVKNDDGSYTVTITKAKHKEMMDEMRVSLDESLQKLIDDGDFGFTEITPNKDYTNFKVNIGENDELGLIQMFSVMAFYTYGGMYNLFNGSSTDNIHVDFVNNKGETVESADSGPLEDYFQSLSDMGTASSDDQSEDIEDTDVSAQVENIEIMADYSLSDGIGWYTRHFYVVTNNSESTVDISTNCIAYDQSGNVVGAANGGIDCVPSGQTVAFYEAFEIEDEIAKYDPTFTVKNSRNKPVLQNLDVKRSDIKGGVVLQVTNNGDIDAEFVEYTALFLKEGKLVDSEWNYFCDDESKLAPGDTISKQMTSRKDYDEVVVYPSGGLNYGR